jgi:hypothetical protein
MQPPRTTEGNVLGAVSLLAAGTALGATLGYQASPLPPANKMVGAIEGGTLGVLVTSFAGLVVGAASPRWNRLGEMTGLVGVGAVAVLALLGSSRASSAAPAAAPPNQISPPSSPSSMTTLTLQAGERYQLVQLAPVPGGVIATPQQAQAFFDAILPGAVHIVSITPAGLGPTTLVFDVLQTLPFTVPSTMPVTDLGPTPGTP